MSQIRDHPQDGSLDPHRNVHLLLTDANFGKLEVAIEKRRLRERKRS